MCSKSLKNDKPSAIYRIKGLTQQNTSSNTVMGSASGLSSRLNSAAIGISIESIEDVNRQMDALSSRSGSNGVDVDNMQMEGSNTPTNSMALVRSGSYDPNLQASMALALAPKIGKCN